MTYHMLREYGSKLMFPEIAEQKDELTRLCTEFSVRRLEVFGSASHEDGLNAHSDIDFLVEFDIDGSGYADCYFGLLDSLESLFQRPIDLVVTSAIKNPFFLQSVESTKSLVYAA